MANLKNSVNPLTWNVPITNSDGTPTREFQQKWGQQATLNGSIPDLTTAAGVSARLDLLGALPGMLLERNATGWAGLASPANAAKFLNGANFPAYAFVKDSDLVVTDITTNNVSITKHGFAPKAPNDATKFLDGTGAYSTPAAGSSAAPASALDDGTTFYLAMQDSSGQLVLDGSGDPIYAPEVLPAAALPSAGGYASGTLDNLTVNKVKGRTDGSAPAAGDVGQFLEVSVPDGSSLSLTTGTPIDITFLDLTPGEWLVWGTVLYEPDNSSTAGTGIFGWINTTSATPPTRPGKGALTGFLATFQLNQNAIAPVGQTRVVATTSPTTRVYLGMFANFTVSTARGTGYMSALRIS